jgi:hypothetical protein
MYAQRELRAVEKHQAGRAKIFNATALMLQVCAIVVDARRAGCVSRRRA